MKTLGWRKIALLIALVFILLPVIWTPDGTVRSDWFRFLGGFHPLIVHFPIALILLVPALEIIGRITRTSGMDNTISLILKLAFVASLGAPLLGWSLAWGDGYSGELMTSHMWAGILVPLCCALLMYTFRNKLGPIYVFMLILTSGLVSWTGYVGGQLAHGKNHLTAHMPDTLRDTFDIEKPMIIAADPNTFYGGRIAPILQARCVTCHGPDKIKGKLRLDNFAAISAGGATGIIITPGNSEISEMYRRITLPSYHDDFMPAEGNPPLSDDEIKLIAMWIDQGASADIAVNAISGAPIVDLAGLPIEVIVPDFDPVGAEADRAALANAVKDIQAKYPYILNYVSRNTGDLDLNATMLRDQFGDADLAIFKPVFSRIVRADFTATAITDTSTDLILSMTTLNTLRLNDTKLSDLTISKLSEITTLKSLNLMGVSISAETKDQLAGLEKLYLD